jgi:hypothetical protein
VAPPPHTTPPPPTRKKKQERDTRTGQAAAVLPVDRHDGDACFSKEVGGQIEEEG